MKKAWIRAFRRHGSGQSTVEFAFASAILMTTMFGTIEFGLAAWQYNMVSNLAQEGARWASVRGSSVGTPATTATVQTYVRSRALGMVPTVTTTWPDGTNAPGNRVRVRVQQSFTPLTNFIPNATLTFQNTAQMVVAR